MPVIQIETFDQFKRRQGCEAVVVGRQISPRTGDDVSRIVFSNGAVSDGIDNHFDPPTDPQQQVAVRLEFVKAKLAREIKDFREYKNSVLELGSLHKMYSNLPPAPAESADLLRAGQQRILQLREELAAMQEQLVDPIALQRQQEAEALEAKRRNDQAFLISEVQQIEI